MANQVQCPNCGGFKIDQNIYQIDPSTGKRIASGCGTWFLEFVVSIVLGLIFSALTQNESMIIVVVPLVFIPLYIWSEIKRSRAKARSYNIYNYECKLCGYKWAWREGTPLPIINIRPDLIAQGEQRLEEERRQRDPRLP
jgi:hypothetical protein